ncbi:MAG: carboxypeptidase regulatory-like domain-containing protein [Candidatus Angelobacter sp.]
MRKNFRKVLAGIFIACLFTLPAFAAQTGDISGTATDTTGAVVVGAKVTIKNLSNGMIRQTTTNDEGQFSVPQVEIGNYEVSIEKNGFKIYKGTTLVRSGENSRIAAKLDVGTTDSIVNVEATVATLDVATAQMSNSLESAEVQSLPNQGRDPVAYATLSPGTVPVSKDNPFLGTGSFNSNGSRGRANNITVDGIISSDLSTTGEAGTGTFSYDGVQEFKLISNNFDAEFGRNSGSQVQIITKGGGNQFHGSAYWFHQNAFFNARDFFNNVTPQGTNGPGLPTPFVQNQGGFTFGGPLYKDHTFFFGHWELDKTRGGGSTAVGHVLTPAQAAGIVDPTSLSLFNNVGAPQSGSGTVSNSGPNQDNGHSYSVRVDQNLHGGRDNFFVRYGENPDVAISPGISFVNSNLPGFGAQFGGTSRNLVIGHTWAPTSAIVNQFRFGFGRSQAQFTPNTPFPLGPEFNVNGISSLGESNIIPQGRTQNTFQYGDTVSWVRGRHTFKFGADVIRYQSPSVFDANFRGTFTFATISDFQNGIPSGFSQRVGTSARHNFALDAFSFVQDDFRLTNTITLNLGFRLESSGGVSEGNDLLSNLDPNNHTPIGALGTGPLGGIDLGGDAFHRNWNPAPRLGVAWNPGRGKLVVRAGYGIAYDYIFLNPITNLRFAAPFIPSLSVSSFTGGNTYAALVAGTAPIQAQNIAAIGSFNPSSINFGSISAVDQNLQNPRNQQWNVGVEYQVLKSLTLKTSYVGTKNDRLQVTQPLNFTNPALRPAPATSLADEEARISQFRSFINGTPTTVGENGNATTGNNRIDQRFNTVTQVQSIGTSNYSALEVEALGKFGAWLTFNANYTWSHSIDDISDVLGVLTNDSATVANPTLPLSANRANSQFDLRHRMNLSYTWRVPFARNMSNGLMKRVFDGWSMSGIFSTQSGFPTTLFSGSTLVPDLAHPGKFLAVTDPLLLGAGTTWLNGDATLVHPSAFVGGVDTSSVSQPLVGAQGTSGRNHLRLDGLTDYDAAITKLIRVTEGQNFQIRWEVFNALNHPNLSGFGNVFTLPGQGFGQYTSTATNMRQMQVALRYQF